MPNFPTSLPADGSMLVAVDFKKTTLNGSITSSAASMTVVDTTGFPDPAGATYYLAIDAAASATREIVGYTGLTGTTFTGLTRHLFGTNNIGHNSGVTVELNVMSQFHELVKAEIVAVATKLGVNSSAVNTTVDFRLAQVAAGDRAVSLTASQTLTNKTLTTPAITTPTISSGMSVGGNITMTTASAKIIAGATDWHLRNTGDSADNILVTDAGAITVRSTIAGVTTLTATSLGGTLTTAAQPNVTSVGTLSSLAVTGDVSAATFTGTVNTAAQATITSVGTLTALSIGGNLTFTGASRRVIAGTTDFSLRNNANSADNILVTDAGAITLRSTVGGITTLTATTLTGTLSTAAQTNVTSLGTLTALAVNGDLTFSGASRRIIAGTTDFSLRNNANNADNLLLTDAGAATFRSTVGGISTLTATSLAGTLTTAAQANVTSVGTLTSVTTSGAITITAASSKIVPGSTQLSLRNNADNADNILLTDAGAATIRAGLTITTGGVTVNAAGTATFNRQYFSAAFAVSFSATPTFDFNNGNVQVFGSMTANVTSSTFSNVQAGGRYIIVLPQDSTGSRTFVWPAAVKWPGGSAPPLSGASKTDVVSLVAKDSSNIYATVTGNF